MQRTNIEDSRHNRGALHLAALGAAAVLCACDPAGPFFHGHGPLAPYDELADAAVRCALEGDDPHDAPQFDEHGPSCGDPFSSPSSGSYSLCACGDIDAANTVTSRGGTDPTDIGTNDGWVSSAAVDIAGTITSGATLRADNTLAADGLRVEHVLVGSSDVHIRGDATLGGMSFPEARVTIDGKLTIPATAPLDGLVSADDIVRADVDVEPPCDCVASVDDIATFDDFDDDIEDPDALAALTGEQTLYFGCGDHHFTRIGAAHELTLVIVGDARIWIERDIEVSGPFAIEIADGASLELFVGGGFAPMSTVELGNPDDPDALRMYVRKQVQTAGEWVLAGSLYAPDANMLVRNTLELRGAIYGESFDFSSPVTLEDGPRFTGDGCVVGRAP